MTKLGRVFFAIPIVVFGLQYLTYRRFIGGLPPVPPWTPGGAAGAYLAGALLVVSGVSILAGFHVRLMSTLFGAFFFICVVALHSQKVSAVIHDGVARTRAFEPLALAGAAWVLARNFPPKVGNSQGSDSFVRILGRIGCYLFAFSMIIFGVQHFMYASFIATLIPAWIPAHLFWAYFTGAAFIGAGAAIATNIQARLGAFFLGLMFLLWTVLLHAPRVFAKPHNGDELTSLFVALSMAGASWILAESGREN